MSQRSFTKSKWLDLNKTNAENWIDLTGKTYHKIQLSDNDKTNIINGNIPSSLRNRLKGILKPGDEWFVRLSTRSIKDSFYQMEIKPLGVAYDIIDRLLQSKRAYEDISYSIKYNTDMYLFLIEWDDKMNIKNEFRCFVKDNVLQCITQYNIYDDINFFEFDVCKIVLAIKFYISDINIGTGVVDVLLDDHFNVTLVEVNPYDRTTSAIFYKWNEIKITEGMPELRYKMYGEIKSYNMV